MKKRLVSLLLVLTILSSLSATALAASYSDLKGHWSESYVTKLSDLGYLTGYTDGTVKPDKTITACEALALLSRFYTVDSATAQWIHEDYGTFVQTYIDPNLSWAYDEIEVCLAAGILSENELKNLRLTAAIDKELLSVLLVRALQLTDEAAAAAANGAELTFADTSTISSAYRGHIAVLVNNGIIEGNSKNQFTPRANVTRGVVSAMVVRGLNYVAQKGKTLVLANYQNFTQRTGVITGVNGSVVTLRDTDGVSRNYTIPTGAAVTVAGEAKTLSDSYKGCYITIRVENDQVASVAVLNEEGVTWQQGQITEISKTSNGYNLYIQNLDTGKSTRILAPTGATVGVNGASKDLAALKAGMFVTITMKSDRATAIAATSGSYTLTGTITTLTYGATVVLKLSAADKSTVQYLLDLTNLPTILRGDNQVSIERLNVGDEVTVTMESCVLKKIAAKSNENTIDGTLTSIIATTSGTTWVITDGTGTAHSLTVDPSAGAYQGNKAILISAVQAGDTVSVVADGKVITEIYLKSSNGNTATKVTGTVLVVDSAAKRVTILNSTGKLVYISTASVGSIITAGGKTLSLSGITTNSQLLAYGSYTDSTNFIATSIIIDG